MKTKGYLKRRRKITTKSREMKPLKQVLLLSTIF